MKNINCPCCKSALQKRNGKFGEFFYCKNSHGTISYNAGKVHTTGEIFKFFNKITKEPKRFVFTSGSVVSFKDLTKDPLMSFIEKQTAVFGGIMSDLDRFLIDGEPEDEYEDHWKNLRD